MNGTDPWVVAIVRKLVERLVASDFAAVEHLTGGIRLPREAIEQAIRDYGGELVMPPEIAFTNLDVIEVGAADPPRLSIRFDLWTISEGRSDLTLELTLVDDSGNGQWRAELDNIHVL